MNIGELIRAVRILLGAAPLSDCRALGRDGDGEATIADVIAAVANALAGAA